MLISCKVSNSVLVSLERQGRDTSLLMPAIDVPEEFLKDTSCWLETPKMEFFLSEVDRIFTDLPEDFVADVGRQCEKLKVWGVLDKVLKMVESPLDIYNQPNRFLSYFVSPEPPVVEWKHQDNCISFQLPVLRSQYPFVTQYLAGALEGLPAYMGQPWAKVTWDESLVQITWSKEQEDLLQEEELQMRQFNPQWVRSVIDSLEKHQHSVESKNLSELQPDGGLPVEYKELVTQYHKDLKTVYSEILEIKDDFLRLNDYFARAQQLITFLVHSGRKTKQVEEAMRRMDWDHVQKSYVNMVDEACDRLLGTKEKIGLLATKTTPPTDESAPKENKSDYVQLPMQ